MTDILPPAGWPNVRQLETNEFALGGANGNMNEQAKALAARSELLKQYAALPYESKTGGYALNERVQLANGDIVRSTIASNVNNPNVDMTGWSPQGDGLTFEMFGVVLNVKTDQASKIQETIDFCEANGIKKISFAGKGTCYLGSSVTFKPRKKNGATSTFWGYSQNRLVIDSTNVIFTPIANNFTMFKFFRDTLKFSGVLNIANGTGVDRRTGVRAFVNGMTDTDAALYPSSKYFQLCGFLSADTIYVSGLETAWDNQAGYYNYYMNIDEFVVRDTNYAMTFLSPTTNKQDQNTRMRIGNFVHEGGFCSVYGECTDSLQIDSFYNEGMNISAYADTRSLIPDGIATGVYIPEKDKWGFVNPYNKILGMTERNDRPTYIQSPTSSFTGIFSRPTGSVLYPNVGLASNGFTKSEYPETIKRLNGVKTSGTAATYGVAITVSETTADPTIKADLPVNTMTELSGSIIYLPDGDGSFATFTRSELLYVFAPFAQRGWWSRRCKIDGTSTGVAWVRVGAEYVDSVAAKLASSALTSAMTAPVGLRGFNWDVATDKPTGLVDYMMGLQVGRPNTAFEIITTLSTTSANNVLKYRRFLSGAWQPVATILSSANTTTDANGFIKAASPIVQLFSDRIEMNEEAQLQSITFEKLGTGDYLIKGSSGLSTDGWYIETPKDANGNILFAVVYETLSSGDISIKTYKKKFDYESASIVADIDNPVDISECRWIDIRLN